MYGVAPRTQLARFTFGLRPRIISVVGEHKPLKLEGLRQEEFVMGPYSLDLRERVAAAIDQGQSQRQVARRFGVSPSFVTRLVQRRREAGTLAPKVHGGGRQLALDFPQRVRLARLISEQPDATLEELKQRGGFSCTLTTLWRTLRRFKLTFKKKSLHPSERSDPKVQAK